MAYYQILKKRRLDLNLSIQDIAIQTQLAPEYIRAIEENNLDVFSDDFSFVRYFIHAYCDAIGVNWMAIAPEVDATISIYAKAKDQALTQAQRRMVESMPNASSKKRKKKKSKLHKIFSSSAGRISRMLSWDEKNTLTKTLIIGAAGILIFLIALNSITDALSAKSQQSAREQKQAELLAKEEETQRLAKQLADQKNSDAVNEAVQIVYGITPDPNQTNVFYITGAISADRILIMQFGMAQESNIQIYSNGEGVFNQDVSGDYICNLTIPQEETLEIVYDAYTSADTLSLSGMAIPINADGFVDGYGIITLKFVNEVPAATDEESAQEQAGDLYVYEDEYDDAAYYDYSEEIQDYAEDEYVYPEEEYVYDDQEWTQGEEVYDDQYE